MPTRVLITDSDGGNIDMNFLYILGFQPSSWAILISETTCFVVLNALYFGKTSCISQDRLKQRLHTPQLNIQYILAKDILTESINILKNSSSIILENNIAIKYADRMIRELPNIEVTLAQWFLSYERSIKSKNEISCIKQACDITDSIYEYIETLKHTWQIQDLSEKQLQRHIYEKTFSLNGDEVSFEPIVAFWKNTAIPHHKSDETMIWEWPLLIDMWVKYKWYCSDFTRTLWIGRKNTHYNLFMEIYSIVREAYTYAIDQFRVGMTGNELDSFARKLIYESWYPEAFSHSLGHGIGLEIHEAPKIAPKSEDILEESMVFTIEPGIYLPGKMWVRLENVVCVQDGKLIEYSNILL